jgi:type II secretory pathway pseudopilin PulG
MNETPPLTSGEPKKLGLAIWSLVLGILAVVLSVVCIGPLFAIPAVICGHMAYGRIRRSGGALAGEGLALGGLITGYISIALIPLMGLMAAIAVPNFVRARDTAQRNACINNLRQIDGAKHAWALEQKKEETDTPMPAEIGVYLKNGRFEALRCPKAGVYSINPVGQASSGTNCRSHSPPLLLFNPLDRPPDKSIDGREASWLNSPRSCWRLRNGTGCRDGHFTTERFGDRRIRKQTPRMASPTVEGSGTGVTLTRKTPLGGGLKVQLSQLHCDRSKANPGAWFWLF